MPLEPNIATVGVLLVAVVLATTAGGLIGRRLRTWREHRTARRALAALATQPPAMAPRLAILAATRPPTITAPASAIRVVGAPDPKPGEPIAEPSYLSRRLAGMPPPVVSRRAPVLASAAVAPVTRPAKPESGLPMPTPPSPGRRRRRRLANVAALACLVFAVGTGIGVVAGGASGPRDGSVLDAVATPEPVSGATDSPGSAPGLVAPGGPGRATPAVTTQPLVDPIVAPAIEAPSPSQDQGAAILDPTAEPTDGPGPAKAAGALEAPGPGGREPAIDRRSGTPAPKPVTAGRTPDPTAATPAITATPEPTPPPTPEPTPEPTPDPTATPAPPIVAFGFIVGGSRVWFANYTWGARSWSWDLGDGDTSKAWNPRHTYAAPGTYTVTLTAVGAGGATASQSHDVQIDP